MTRGYPGTRVAMSGRMKKLVWFAFAVLGACSDSKSDRIAAYLTSDTCHEHADATLCASDPACQWIDLDIACTPGETCPTGVCAAVDPCAPHGDQASCTADAANGCAWANTGELCPATADCASDTGGFCYRPDPDGPGGGCACACPVACVDGQDCPPCDCDCGCGDPSTGSGGGGTTSTTTMTPTDDPCLAIADATTCRADTADECTWSPYDLPCMEGSPCPSGSCHGPVDPGDGGGGTGCACACPACAPGEVCPPCACDCPTTCTPPVGPTPPDPTPA